MSAMPTFSHHPLSVSPSHNLSSGSALGNNGSQQCLMQSNSQQPLQSQQLQRDLISPSPYQCHMSVRSGPLTPTASSVSASSLAAAAAAAYDSLGLVVSGSSSGGSVTRRNDSDITAHSDTKSCGCLLSSTTGCARCIGNSSAYNSARHSPSSPSQNGSSIYPLNPSTPFGLTNNTNGATGKYPRHSYYFQLTLISAISIVAGLISPGVSVPIPVAIPVQPSDMTSQYWSRLQ